MTLDILGIVGVLLVLIGYFLVQTGRVRSDQLIFPILNFIGASLITVSLFKNWNLPAFVMEFSFVLISGWGILYVLKKKKQEKKNDDAV